MSSTGNRTVQFPDDCGDDDGGCPDLMPSGQNVESRLSHTSDAIPSITGTASEIKENGFCGPFEGGSTRTFERTESGSDLDTDSDSSGDEEDKNVGQGDCSPVDDWKLEDGAQIICECLVCNHSTSGYEAADLMKDHIESAHELSFEKLKTVFKLSYQDFVQFVRWARDMKEQGTIKECIKDVWSVSPDKVPWMLEKYMLPSSDAKRNEDYFLTLDFFLSDNPIETGDKATPPVEELLSTIKQLELDQLRMVEVLHRLLLENAKSCTSFQRTDDQNESEDPKIDPLTVPQVMVPKIKQKKKGFSPYQTHREIRKDRTQLHPTASGTKTSSCSSYDDLYFDSYNEVEIHSEMIFDSPRTDAYRMAIEERKDDIKGKLVMDVGCGTGILSMFCAQHDPKLVFAIDKSEIIYDAMSNGFENDYQSKIKFLRKDVSSDVLEGVDDKVDVIVSEFMGYFLFFEGMTETFIEARDKYLKPGGILLPDKCVVEMIPLGSEGLYKSKVLCWDNAYGFKMSALQMRVLNDTHIELVNTNEVIGAPVQVKNLDLYTCSVEDVYIDQDFEFEFTRDAEFCAVAGYFSVDFTGVKNKVVLSTSPWEPPTHWKQAVFFLPRRISVKAGEKMKGHISSFPHEENPRWLVVQIQVNGLTKKYEFR